MRAGLGLDLLPRLLEPPLSLGIELLPEPPVLCLGDVTRLREHRLRVFTRLCSASRCSATNCSASARARSASSSASRIRSRRASIAFWIGLNAYRRRTKNVIPNAMSVQIIRPGTTLISPESATMVERATSDQDVREQTTDEAVEDDRLGEREAEPLDALQLRAELGLAGDRLDHRAEDVADADAGA